MKEIRITEMRNGALRYHYLCAALGINRTYGGFTRSSARKKLCADFPAIDITFVRK